MNNEKYIEDGYCGVNCLEALQPTIKVDFTEFGNVLRFVSTNLKSKLTAVSSYFGVSTEALKVVDY